MKRKSQNMIKYLIKRILFMVPMLIAVLIFTWLLSHMMSVNPVANKIGFSLDPDVYEAELRRIGYYDPWYVQLGIYLQNFFTGDWGTSYIVLPDKPVLEIIATIFPKTIELMIFPIVIVPIIAVKLGVLSAKNKNKSKDIFIRLIAILGAGFPVFWIATLLQRFVGISLSRFTYGGIAIEVVYSNSPDLVGPPTDNFPPVMNNLFSFLFFLLFILGIILLYKNFNKFRDSKRNKNLIYTILGSLMVIISLVPIILLVIAFFENSYGTGFRIIDSFLYNNQIYLWDTLIHLLLPVISITFVSLAGITRLTRSSMLEVMDQDYIRTARAKGVLEKDVINKHALRNALLPTSNLIIGGTASALLGSLFIEVTFNYRGFGYYMVDAIFKGDFLVINGLLVFATIIILTGTLVADVMYTIIDPRIIYR